MMRTECIGLALLIEALSLMVFVGFATSEWNPYWSYTFFAAALYVLPIAYFLKFPNIILSGSPTNFFLFVGLHIPIFLLYGLLTFFSIDPEESIPDEETMMYLFSCFALLRFGQFWILHRGPAGAD